MTPDLVARLNAAVEGRYLIERPLGEGGMATVFLASDLKHERRVALKVLKPELAAVVGGERFLAEIKTTANLQHPHILPLFDSGEADGFLYYVMPYVEGETLRDRLDREHQLPVNDAVHIAENVAEALQYAHEKGVIHRDIKPANILLLQGKPLIADFGIALAVGAAGGGRLTETGLSVGTPHYMSPEQATGDSSVGPAADIYALGCVLYECLIGEPPHTGGTAQAVLGKIITEMPAPIREQRALVPANVEAAVSKALEKVPADRFRDAAHLARALGDPGFGRVAVGTGGTGGAPGAWRPIALALGVATAAMAALLAWSSTRPAPQPERPVQRFVLDIETIGLPGLLPDGSGVVYVAGRGPEARIFLRRWEDLDPVPIQGTEGDRIGNPSFPQVSPSGDEVVFALDGGLKVVPIRGGLARSVADTTSPRMQWNSDGFIYFQGSDLGIHRVPAEGGTTEAITQPVAGEGGEVGHVAGELHTDRDVVLFTTYSNPPQVEALRLSTGERRVLTAGNTPYFTREGHVVFGSSNGDVLASRFDVERMELVGQPEIVLQGVRVSNGDRTRFALSPSGALIYSTGSSDPLTEFVWVTRSGQVIPVDPSHQFSLPQNHGFRLSPDESRVAFTKVVDTNSDIWIKHLPRGPEERLTLSVDIDYRPIWAPDGGSITYFSGPAAADRNVWSIRTDRADAPVLLLDDERSLNQGSWTPDGQWLVVRSTANVTMGLGSRDVLAFRPGEDTTVSPVVADPDFSEGAPAVSPDGQWLAYTSNRTGRDEVYVRPFPNTDSTRVAVSSTGGMAPVWSKDGRELFYVDFERRLVAAAFDGSTGRVLRQDVLFTLPAEETAANSNSFYDVTADGERFLMVRPYFGENGAEAPRLVFVQNFTEVVNRLLGGN